MNRGPGKSPGDAGDLGWASPPHHSLGFSKKQMHRGKDHYRDKWNSLEAVGRAGKESRAPCPCQLDLRQVTWVLKLFPPPSVRELKTAATAALSAVWTPAVPMLRWALLSRPFTDGELRHGGARMPQLGIWEAGLAEALTCIYILEIHSRN